VIRIQWDLPGCKGTKEAAIIAPIKMPPAAPYGDATVSALNHGGVIPWSKVTEFGPIYVAPTRHPSPPSAPTASPNCGYLLELVQDSFIGSLPYTVVVTSPTTVVITPINWTVPCIAAPTSLNLAHPKKPTRYFTYLGATTEWGAQQTVAGYYGTASREPALVKPATVGKNTDPLGVQVSYLFYEVPLRSLTGVAFKTEWTWDGTNWGSTDVAGTPGYGNMIVMPAVNGWLFSATIDDVTGEVASVTPVPEGRTVSTYLWYQNEWSSFWSGPWALAITWPTAIRKAYVYFEADPIYFARSRYIRLVYRLAGPRRLFGDKETVSASTANSVPNTRYPKLTGGNLTLTRGVVQGEQAFIEPLLLGTGGGGGWAVLGTASPPPLGAAGWVEITLSGPAVADEILVIGNEVIDPTSGSNYLSGVGAPISIWPEATVLPCCVPVMHDGLWNGGTA